MRIANASIHVIEEETAELVEEDFILKVTPSTQNMKQAGEVVRYNVDVDPIGGFDEKVSLSVRLNSATSEGWRVQKELVFPRQKPGVHPKIAMDLLGHSDINLTMAFDAISKISDQRNP